MAEIERTPEGEVPAGKGWYVLNAKHARWLHLGSFGGSHRRVQRCHPAPPIQQREAHGRDP